MTSLKRTLSFLVILCIISGSFFCFASLDDTVPSTTAITQMAGSYVLYAPDGESTDANPNNLVLNMFCSGAPTSGTNVTRAPFTDNSTQWWKRCYFTYNGTMYFTWAPYGNTTLSINCRRTSSTGTYVNVVPMRGNNLGDLNVHSPNCFISNNGSHHLAVPSRSVQPNIMVICKTTESTGYTNNTYLVWRSLGTSSAAHVFIYKRGSGYINGSCMHQSAVVTSIPTESY